jgi:hypothetical protein
MPWRKTTIYRSFIVAIIGYLAMSQSLLAQFGSGALLDENKYVSVPLAAPLTSETYEKIPYRYSLKNYCPNPGDQRESGTCVGWAVGYGARTMIEAISKGWTTLNDKDSINNHAFSPSFIYNTILDNEGISDCSIGGYIVDALDLLKQKGVVLYQQFPFDENCQQLPDTMLKQEALKYRIMDYQRLTFYNKDDAKTNKVRDCIANNLPVVVGIKILDNLKNPKHDKFTWNPKLSNQTRGITHAMVVVGYDDTEQTFELMNSWGDEWCNDGFFYISYADFNQYVREAYVLIFDRPAMKNRNDQTNLAANINFKLLATEGTAPNIACTNQTIGKMSAVLRSDSTYKMINAYEAWTGYQVWLTTQQQNMAVYAFSYDPSGKTDLLYPFQPEVIVLYGEEKSGTQITPIIPSAGSTIALPHEDYCMQLDDQGGTINCFLFSRQPIDIKKLLHTIETSSGTFAQRLQKAIPDKRRANNKLINYANYGIGFDANVADYAIVPVVIDMNHR